MKESLMESLRTCSSEINCKRKLILNLLLVRFSSEKQTLVILQVSPRVSEEISRMSHMF